MRALPRAASALALLLGLSATRAALADPPASAPQASFGATSAPAASFGPPPSASEPHGIELGLRSGYSLAAGNASSRQRLDGLLSGAVPVWVDAGYRTRQIYAGAFFQYGVGVIPGNSAACADTSCDANDVVVGLDVHAHLRPAARLDPWLGAGIGYEWLDFALTPHAGAAGAAAPSTSRVSLSGWQFVDFQIGLDYRDESVLPGLGLGPFAMVGIGQYATASGTTPTGDAAFGIPRKDTHAWITFGLRVAYDLALGGDAASTR